MDGSKEFLCEDRFSTQYFKEWICQFDNNFYLCTGRGDSKWVRPILSPQTFLNQPPLDRGGFLHFFGAGDAVEGGGDDAPRVACALAGGVEAGDADVLEGLRVAGKAYGG